MKRIEWVIAISLVVTGLSCLTMSATWFTSPGSIEPYLNTFFLICLWAVVPVIVAILIYLLVKKKNK